MGKMGEELDKFYVEKIYSTKPGTAELYISDNIASDNYNDGVYYQKLNRIRNIGGEKTRSNDMCFKKSMVDQEVTGYFKYVNDLASADAKLRGGHHSNGNDDSARCYIFAIKSLKFQKVITSYKRDIKTKDDYFDAINKSCSAMFNFPVFMCIIFQRHCLRFCQYRRW